MAQHRRLIFWPVFSSQNYFLPLAMIGALFKMQEWELHCRGAVHNSVSQEEIRAIIHVIGIYSGVPQALECFRAARKVLEGE